MSEPGITPLAQRLAEENNVDWRTLRGSGEEGRVVERDVLEYLARVMAGEEAVNPTPEPVPDGMEAWPEADAWSGPEPVDTAEFEIDDEPLWGLDDDTTPAVTGEAAGLDDSADFGTPVTFDAAAAEEAAARASGEYLRRSGEFGSGFIDLSDDDLATEEPDSDPDSDFWRDTEVAPEEPWNAGTSLGDEAALDEAALRLVREPGAYEPEPIDSLELSDEGEPFELSEDIFLFGDDADGTAGGLEDFTPYGSSADDLLFDGDLLTDDDLLADDDDLLASDDDLVASDDLLTSGDDLLTSDDGLLSGDDLLTSGDDLLADDDDNLLDDDDHLVAGYGEPAAAVDDFAADDDFGPIQDTLTAETETEALHAFADTAGADTVDDADAALGFEVEPESGLLGQADDLLDDSEYEDADLTDLALEDGELDDPLLADDDLRSFEAGQDGTEPGSLEQRWRDDSGYRSDDDSGYRAAQDDGTGDSTGDSEDQAAGEGDDTGDSDAEGTGFEVDFSQIDGWEEAADDDAGAGLGNYAESFAEALADAVADEAEVTEAAADEAVEAMTTDAAADETWMAAASVDEDAFAGEDTLADEHAVTGEHVVTDEDSYPADVAATSAPAREDAAADDLDTAGETAWPVAEEDVAPAAPAGQAYGSLAAAAASGLPLANFGTLLRRHLDVSQLNQAQHAVGLEIEDAVNVNALPFLLRAAARALEAAPLGETDGTVAAALIGDGGVTLASDTAGGFRTLAQHLSRLAQAAPEEGTDTAGVRLVVADMSALQVDEAVLDLGVPVLTLGRILHDSERGTFQSTLTLSGHFEIQDGARFLQLASELLANPLRLLI